MNNKNYTEADLLQEWKAMSAKRFDNKKLEKQKIMNAIKSNSQLTIATLKRALELKIKLSVAIILLAVGIMLSLNQFDTDFWLVITFCATGGILCLFLYGKFNKMDDRFRSHTSLLENMNANLKTIKDALFMERVWSYAAYFIVFVFQTYTWISNSTSPIMTISMIVILLFIFIVLGILSERSNYKKFGKHIKELEENIIRLDTLQ